MEKKYDIFISYRREGGAQYARILQLMLLQRGYRVFLDYDELSDGKFGNHIKDAIEHSSIFMIILSNNSLRRCKNEDDWVRKEILYALELEKILIPVNPDSSFDGIPADIPSEIVDEIKNCQQSEVSFGQLLGVTVDFMIDKRIAPSIGTRLRLDSDYNYLNQQLAIEDEKRKRHRLFIKSVVVFSSLIVVMMVGLAAYMFLMRGNLDRKRDVLITQMESHYPGLNFMHNDTISIEQLGVINEIFENMRPVKGDSLKMAAFETSEKQYYTVLGEAYNTKTENLPITNISFGQCVNFIAKLNNLINSDNSHIEFSLPTEEEWEYAAFGGERYSESLYAGSNDPDSVAWYSENSNGMLHPANGQNQLHSNGLGLFDMCGNASEYVFTPFVDFDNAMGEGSCMIVKGGNYASSKDEIKIKNRKAIDIDSSSPKIGFRLVLRNK